MINKEVLEHNLKVSEDILKVIDGVDESSLEKPADVILSCLKVLNRKYVSVCKSIEVDHEDIKYELGKIKSLVGEFSQSTVESFIDDLINKL